MPGYFTGRLPRVYRPDAWLSIALGITAFLTRLPHCSTIFWREASFHLPILIAGLWGIPHD
jgi:hypothetical protein